MMQILGTTTANEDLQYFLRASFYQWLSGSQSRNQKRRAIGSIVKIKLMVWTTDSTYGSVACENYIVIVRSSWGRINQSQCSILGFVIGWFFCLCFCFLLWPLIVCTVINRMGRNGNVMILLTPITGWAYHSDFSIFTRLQALFQLWLWFWLHLRSIVKTSP